MSQVMPKQMVTVTDALQLRDYLGYVNQAPIMLTAEEAEQVILLAPIAASFLKLAAAEVTMGSFAAVARFDLSLSMTMDDPPPRAEGE